MKIRCVFKENHLFTNWKQRSSDRLRKNADIRQKLTPLEYNDEVYMDR